MENPGHFWVEINTQTPQRGNPPRFRQTRSRSRGIQRGRGSSAKAAAADAAAAGFQPLSLGDSLDVLDYLRRTFARWWLDDGSPGDAFSVVRRETGDASAYLMPSKEEHEEFIKNHGTAPVAGWVAALLDPIRIDGDSAEHFGDERAFMTSVVALATPGESAGDRKEQARRDRGAFRSIHDGAFFRLAEADRNGPGHFYQRPFLNGLREAYFYDRHAPDPEGDFGNTTRWITAPHHLCGVGTGSFMTSDAIPNCDKYYAVLQFVCVFEYYRLLQFSQRLSNLVAQKFDMAPALFRAQLLAIREDFLSFTHLHHFVNVTHQLQPAEMFTRLHRVMGLDRLFREVEDELRSAADYAALREAEEAAARGERLNGLLSLGVPAALTVGALGMNVLIGERFPDIAGGWFCAARHPARWDFFQASVVVALVLGLWWLAERLLLGAPAKDRTELRLPGWAVFAALGAVAVALAAMHAVFGPCAPP